MLLYHHNTTDRYFRTITSYTYVNFVPVIWHDKHIKLSTKAAGFLVLVLVGIKQYQLYTFILIDIKKAAFEDNAAEYHIY